MPKSVRIATILLGGVVFIFVAGLAAERLFLSSVVVDRGEAFGFSIGQTRKDAYESAKLQIKQGRASEVHVWPHGEFHRPFRDSENPLTDNSPSWSIIVDPEWWNNSVTLTFEGDRVVEIRRNRILWELP
jgi:hypothetical protein